MDNDVPTDALQRVFDELSQEETQEEASQKLESSLLSDSDPEILREREREYRDDEKHWVRRNPWLKVAKEIALEASEKHGRGIRYLTLPGFYRLDVSLLLKEKLLEAEFDADGAIRSAYVAAFEADPTKHGRMVGHLPEFRLFGLSNVEDALTVEGNPYYSQLLELFPFDIINLDLTTSLTPAHEGPYSKTMRAIEAVFSRQAEYASKWALFLTFRNVPTDWEAQTLEQLFDELQRNLDQYPKAHEVFRNLYSENTVSQLNMNAPERCISQAVAKWLVDRANSHNIRLNSMSCYSYKRYPLGIPPYLISKHVFTFSRGQVLPGNIPTKGTPRQSWMEDNVVTCIERHRCVDVEEKLVQLSHSVPDIWERLRAEVSELCHSIA
jgi:hypothetical protein